MKIHVLSMILVAGFVSHALGGYDCINQCTCVKQNNELIVDCSDANFTKVPQPENNYQIHVLHLQHNEISSIGPGVFNGQNNESDSYFGELKTLDLQGNRLEILQDGIFSNLHNLTTLLLGNNSISTVSSQVFIGLSGLEILYLEDNNISSIFAGTFDKLVRLKTLYLGNNHLSTFQAGQLHSLTFLDISQNYLTEFPKLSAEKLLKINASWNKLENLKSGTFNGVPKLQYLYLRHCGLSKLGKNVFDGTPNLTFLDLTANRISNFPNFKISTLQRLLIGNNKIKTMPEKLNTLFPNIKTLLLGNNSIEYLNPNIFVLSSMKHLDLSNNRLYCNCNLHLFANWLVENTDIVLNLNSMLCQDPGTNFKKPILKTMHELKCENSDPPKTQKNKISIGISITVMMISFGLIILMIYIYNKYRQNREANDESVASDNGDIRLMSSRNRCCFDRAASCDYTCCFKFGRHGRGRVVSEEMRDLMIASPVTSPMDKDAPVAL